jgi:nitrile hydratase subunit beta
LAQVSDGRGARAARPQYPNDLPAEAVRFAPGERVQVRQTAPLGHIRTPSYIRGCCGTIERLCGAFPNPEELAQQRSGLPAQPLYRVRFLQKDVWPRYRGNSADVIEVEIFQHWLDNA